MATVARENIGKLTDKLTVTIAKNDYLPSFEQSLKKYAKTANIPGFRKGLVPAGMIKKMYGKSIFVEEVLRSVEKELNNYMQTENLEVFGQPLPLDSDSRQLDMNSPEDYMFAFEIGLKPAIDIDVKNITITRNRVAITDAMVNEEVDRLKLRHGKMTDQETVGNEDNLLNVTFAECDAEGNVIEGGISKGNSLLVKYFKEGFRSQLTDKKVNDTLVLTLNEAFEEKEKSWLTEDLGLNKEEGAAGDKHFLMTITKIGLIEKPEMDETFFGAAFPGKAIATETEFREAVKDSLQAQWDVHTKNQADDQIYHHLVDHTTIEFPEAFLKRWLQQGDKEPKTAEEAEAEYPSFAKSLKWSLITNQLLTQNNIQIMPEEIKAFAKQQVMGYMGIQNLDEAPWLEGYADSMLKDQKFVENTYYQLQTTKLFEVLGTQVNVIENTVTPDELQAMQHNHQH